MMWLTSEYTRVAAPHAIKCPLCGRKVWDWYVEWYEGSLKSKVFRGEEPMDCPWCRGSVFYDSKSKTVVPAPENAVPNQRSMVEAALYAEKKGYPNLKAFLVSHSERFTATPFRLRYWPLVYLPVRKHKKHEQPSFYAN